MNPPQQNDPTQRDDIIIFSEALSKSSHNIKNIKNYRKLHHDVLKRNQGFPNTTTQCTNQQRYVWTIDNSERVVEQLSQERMNLNLDGLPVRRTSVTAGNSRRRNQDILKTQSRTLNLCNNISTRQPTSSLKKKEIKQNKFSFIQKKYNKGPLKDKYLSSWLNSLLLQACQDEKFDSTIENPALKKYGLDQNSLKSKGIKPENLSRIYKSLFVYSIGFNDLLREICDKNMNLRKTIWKVFAILLQYCAQGDFETMIAQIQRDKLQKIQNLTTQIHKRQKQIENSDELNQKKNQKIYKQIKQLRQQNTNLHNQKQVLLQQFKQAEQAFNQEVSLRLKYENKINQIHGVYAEIENKHLRLVNDYQGVMKEVEKLRVVVNTQGKLCGDLKKDNQVKAQEIIALQKDLKYKIQLIAQLQTRKHGDANLNIQNINNIKQLKSIIEQKQRHISQLNLSIKNMNVILQTEKEEHQKTSDLFAQSLQENSRLHGTIQEQMKDLNQLLYEKRNFGMETSNIQAQIILLQSKLQQKTLQAKQLSKSLQSQTDEHLKTKAHIEAQKKLKIQLQQDLKQCYSNIKQMKIAKNEIEQQNNERKRKMQNIDQIIIQKEQQINQQKIVIEEFNNQISSAKLLIKTLESKLEVLNQKVKTDEEIYSKKIHNLKTERDLIQKQFLEFDYVKKVLQLERDRFRSQYQERDLGFKNEKFEKIQLQGFYDFSLKAGEEKNQEIKRLDIKISELNEQISSLKRKMKSMEYISEQKQKRLTKQKQFWTQRVSTLNRQNKQRRIYIHPLIYQDVCQNFRIKSQALTQLQSTSSLQIKQLTEQLQSKQTQIKQLKQKHQNEIVVLIHKYDQILEKKENQILYQVNKTGHLKDIIKELQGNLGKYQGMGKEMSFQREERYLVDIKQKKQQIQVLLKDLEKAHDLNKTLRENYLTSQQSLPQKQLQLTTLKTKLQESTTKYEQILHQKQKKLQQKQEQIQKLRQSQAAQQKQKQKQREKKQMKMDKSRDLSRSKSGKKNQRDEMREEGSGGGVDSRRNDFVRKYKGAYIYYAK